MIYRNNGGRAIGKLEGNTFKKAVQKSKHLMKVNNSWGIQEEVLKELPDAIRIEIFDKEEKITYLTTAGEFRKNCTYLNFPSHGLQAFLALEFFTLPAEN